MLSRLTQGFMPGLAVFALAAAALFALANKAIRTISVDGALSAAEQQEVRGALSGLVGGGLLTTDIDAVAERLRALSWPRAVSVRRVWPDRLAIAVRKAVVVARWGEEHYLTSAAEVVALPSELSGVPRLDCAHATPMEAMELLDALDERAQALRLSIAALEQNTLGEWTLELDNGLVVRLGMQRVKARMDRFAFAYARALRLHGGTIAAVDARYANGLAVRFNDMIAETSADAR